MANIYDELEAQEAVKRSRSTGASSGTNPYLRDPGAAPLSQGPRQQGYAVPQAKTLGGAFVGSLERGLRMASNAATFGMRDRLGGAIDAATSGKPYGQAVDEQVMRTQASREHAGPLLAGTADAAGGLATGLGLARAGIGFARSATEPLWRKITKSGIEGGLQGAVAGAGQTYSGNLPDYIRNANFGMGLGTAIGAAAPAAGAAARGTYKALADRWSGIPVPIAKAGRADVAGLTALPQHGDAAMLVDAGPSMLNVAQGAALGYGPARTMIVGAQNARNAGRGRRLLADRQAALGTPPREHEVRADIDAERRLINQDYPPAVQGIVLPPQVSDQLAARINYLGQSRNVDLGQTLTDLRRAPPDPQSLLNARHRLGTMIRDAEEAINNPLTNNPPNARYNLQTYREAYDAINDTITQHAPNVRPVDARFAANAAEGQAFQRGIDVLDKGKGAMDPVDLRRLLQIAPPAVRDRMGQGVNVDLNRRIGTLGGDTADLNVLRNTLRSQWPQQNISLLFGRRASDRLQRGIARETHFADAHNRITGGPHTAEKLASAGQQDAAPRLTGDTLWGDVKAFGRWGADKLRTAQQEEQRQNMARWLAERDPAEVDRLRLSILRHNATVEPRAAATEHYGTAAARGVGTALANPVVQTDPSGKYIITRGEDGATRITPNPDWTPDAP